MEGLSSILLVIPGAFGTNRVANCQSISGPLPSVKGVCPVPSVPFTLTAARIGGNRKILPGHPIDVKRDFRAATILPLGLSIHVSQAPIAPSASSNRERIPGHEEHVKRRRGGGT